MLKSLSNTATILSEHSLCPQLCPIQGAADQSGGHIQSRLGSGTWHKLLFAFSVLCHDIHATPSFFLPVDHPEVSPWFIFVASNSKPLRLT